MDSNVTSQASMTTRASVWFSALPLTTRAVFLLCVGIYGVCLLSGFDNLALVCFSPVAVFYRLQIYRFLTAALFHIGLLHVAFNMLAFLPVGAVLERQLGTLQFAYLLLLFNICGSLFFAAASFVASLLLSDSAEALNACAVGLSGAIFALIVVETHFSGAQTRSVFGLFALPAKFYPWVLLVVWQLLMPGVSFLGHLGGVAAGQAYTWGWLHWVVPPAAAFQAAEGWRLLSSCVRLSAFIAHPGIGGTSPSPALPTSTRASVVGDRGPGGGGSGGGAARPPAWFTGGWLPVPSAEPSAGETGRGGTVSGGTISGGSGSRAPGGSGEAAAFKGRGQTLGGPAAAAPERPASSAAAAAAEARVTRAGSSGGAGGRSGGPSGGPPAKQPGAGTSAS
ncbi:hypothetical protein WJX81_002070 [Elliptochloris bilobata]|uniref:Peptidase S54 rhomboid domain-containing protein n=1 Tax=Elliptochloris bilobata TaxID=381761 RepID=A0AAW1SCX4_9CHLO